MNRRFLTTGEAADHCGVHFRTVLRWIARGRLRAYALPGRGDHRIRAEDFVAFLRRHGLPVPEELSPGRRRVLIVEDDAPMAKLIQRALRGAGFETRVAADGFRAGTLLGTVRPAVMTLDLQMPGLPGMDVLRFVRATESLSAVRILVVSAMPRALLDEALAAGADDVLPKPFDRADLVERVRRLAGVEAAAVAE